MTHNILITGANRGLGLAITTQLLAQGHQVFAVNRHHGDALSDLQASHPGRLRLVTADISDEGSVREAIDTVSATASSLDILINNAAMHAELPPRQIERVDFTNFLTAFQVNSVAPLMIVKHALPLLRHGRKKLVVNVSSEAGSIGRSGRTREYSYCMSKAALNMGSRILQNGLKGDGIKVLAIHPGWFSSDMGGPNAPITPAQAAENVLPLLLADYELDDPVYLNYDGKKLEW